MNVEIKNVSHKYLKNKNKSLDNVNMSITKGIFGLIGENGAGKTTLLKTLATVMPVQDGAISIDGYDITKDIEKVRRHIGYLPQKFDFFESLTVYEMLDYIALLKNVKAEEREHEITLLIQQFNLQDKINSKIKSLSGGMKQRLAIAQSLLGNPKLVILDEPTVGLDPNERLRFRNIINEKSGERIIIISTHIISDIAMLCNNIGIMKKGKVVYCGSIDNLLELVEGKIYVDKLNIHDEVDRTKYKKIISILRKKNVVEVRFILDTPLDATYEQVTPTLEDAYFYIMFLDEGVQL
ncbi:ATP-binding cassette domain-containing protein [Tepidibacter thalassicus]|uniref:ABC transporter n=1 Tax=Tepidibacter thalassicus DSM 15285 TaxID=1123350 RepID=A0A1M5RLK9_9FIRM|nr:ATP-binding cassette domain-containing protein [Tepidibacter thalassicus]SHH27105.1 ABC transporter [Tepidibacter thalassicus DSM 15285]